METKPSSIQILKKETYNASKHFKKNFKPKKFIKNISASTKNTLSKNKYRLSQSREIKEENKNENNPFLLFIQDEITPENINFDLQNAKEKLTNWQKERIKIFIKKLDIIKFILKKQTNDNFFNEILNTYKGKCIEKNNIIFRYGEPASNFYIIHKGEVNLYFPLVCYQNMNIDEYYIYLLNLRKYNELSLLNDVLLLNNSVFMPEKKIYTDFDNFLIKLYNTYIKLKYDPFFLRTQNKEDIFFPVFNSIQMKELVLRIKDYIIETIKCVMPEKICFYDEKNNDIDFDYTKLKYIPEELIEKYKDDFNPNVTINKDEYIKRILPIKAFNNDLEIKNVIIMKYVMVDTIKQGKSFGNFSYDNRDIISIMSKFIDKSQLNIDSNFKRKLSAVNICNNDIFLGVLNHKIYFSYFHKYIETKKKLKIFFILKNSLFHNIQNDTAVRFHSMCFTEKKLKQGEFLFTEDSKNKKCLYLICDGEFEANCTKTIAQLDKIIILFGKKNEIKYEMKNHDLYKEWINTKNFFRLNYFGLNDIVGLSELMFDDKYFNNVVCKSQRGTVLMVNIDVLELLSKLDENIVKNREKIINGKRKALIDILINQRNVFYESLIKNEKNPLIKKLKIPSKQVKLKYIRNNISYETFIKYKKNPENPKSYKLINSISNIKDIKKKINNYGLEICQYLSPPNPCTDRTIIKNTSFKNLVIKHYSKELQTKLKRHNSINNIKKIYYKNLIKNRSTLSAGIKKIIPSLRLNKKDSVCDYILDYDTNNSHISSSTNNNTSGVINMLAYDDFNRKYNTARYFNLRKKIDKLNNSNSEETEYNLSLRENKNINSDNSRDLSNKNLKKYYIKEIRKLIFS